MLGVYLNFLLFSFFASITPGPTNLISLSMGARQGAYSAVSFTFGASCSAAFILLLACFGISKFVSDYPLVMAVMSVAGGVWISHMAWQLWFAKTVWKQCVHSDQQGWRQGAILQFANPKTWMMATSATAIFSNPSLGVVEHSVCLSLIILVVSFPCLMSWSFLGAGIKRINKAVKWETLFNRCLAVMLFGLTWSAVVFQLRHD